MAGRHRRRLIGCALVALVVGAGVALTALDGGDPDAAPDTDAPAAAADPRPGTYANPVADGANRNPAVLRTADGTYYAYVDGFDMDAPFRVMAYSSTDLATWTPVGDVLGDPGAWAESASGRGYTSPSVRHVPDAPPEARYVLYLTAPTAAADDGPTTCIGVATAPAPDGPFVGADEPLLCPPGGARAASPVPGSDQVVFRAEQPTPGVYGIRVGADGTTVAAGAEPALLLAAEDGILRRGVLERPAIARHDGRAYLFVRSGDEADGVGWSPCLLAGDEVVTCAGRRQMGSWLAPTAEVTRVGGVQVFTDGDGASWIAYDGGADAAQANLRIDKLCFAHDVPRTDGPTTGERDAGRRSGCSADVPGVALALAATADDERVDQPPEVSFRDGGATVPLGGRLLWLFRDTYIDPATSAEDGPCYLQGASRSNSAGLGLPHPVAGARGFVSPLAQQGPDEACTVEYVPLTDDEHLFNLAQNDVGRRVVLWESGGIPLADGSALVFFVKAVQNRDGDGDGPDPGCPFCFTYEGTGIVRVEAGEDVADRLSTPVGCLPTCLFGPTDDAWIGRPFVADGFVYMYSDTPGSRDPAVRLGRAPLVDVGVRSAWTFRTAEGDWSADIADAVATPGLAVRPPTVSYNGYLDRFVSVVATGPDVVSVQTAPDPWGPWSDPTPIYDWSGVECPGVDAYGAVAAPWLDDAGGRVLRFAFSRPGPDFGRDATCPGEMRIVTVTLV